MIAQHARPHCASPTIGRVRTELRNQHWTIGYIPLLRGELNTTHTPGIRTQHDDWSTPTPDVLQAVFDGLRKL